MSSEYQNLKRRLDESIHKEEARQKILRAKKAEKKALKKAGGGHTIAKSMLGGKSKEEDKKAFKICTHDPNTCTMDYCSWSRCNEPDSSTDFNYGANETESVDQRIAREHAERCMERIVCNVCGFSFGFCQELQDEKEKIRMLPSGNEQSSGKRTTKSGIKWLAPEDLNTTPQEAKILSVFYNKDGRYGARVEMKLAFDGEIVYWGVEPKKDSKSPNYKLLLEKFGANENDWIDQRILLYTEAHKFYEGQWYIRVDFPANKPSTKSRG